ncbi:MAG: ABC-2 transporter permease [Ruminiclostridium sp.]
MKGFLYKNLLLYRPSLSFIGCMLIISSLFVIILSNMLNSVGMQGDTAIYIILFFCLFWFSGFFNGELFKQDESRVVNSFIISAPKGSKRHIASKYIIIFGIYLITFLVCFGDSLLSNMELNNKSLILIFFFSVNLFFSAVSIPFYVRFGADKGNGIKFIPLAILAFALVIYLLFGDISFMFEDDVVIAFLNYISGSSVETVFALSPAVAIVLYLISYKISSALYIKGAENYE